MRKPGESGVMLAPDGSIFHLRLRPGDIAPLILLVGDPGRVTAISRYFDRVELERQNREFRTHTGWIGKQRLSVVSTGIGTDNIDIVIQELDALFNLDLRLGNPLEQTISLRIVRLGTSGGIPEDLQPDSQILSAYALGLDLLMHFYRTRPNKRELDLLEALTRHLGDDFGEPYLFGGSEPLLERFSREGWAAGITVTCPGFFGPQGRRLRIPLTHPDLISRFQSFRYAGLQVMNLEMESSGIYGLGRALGHECLSISTVIVNRATGAVSGDVPGAMDRMISRSLEILCAP